MADYYPLLARAVAGLPESTADTRRAIYERARKALVAQLRKVEPPIADADIARENGALDEAIARLESEIAGQAAREALGETAPAAPTPKPEKKPETKVEPKVEPKAETQADKKTETSDKNTKAKSDAAAPVKPEHVAPPPKIAMPPRAEPRPEPSKPFSFRAPQPPAAKAAEPADDTSAEAPAAAPPAEEIALPDLKTPRPRETVRPAAPQPASGEQGRRLWILGGVAAGIVLLVAGFAIVFKSKPEDLARLRPAPGAPPAEAPQSGKIAGRVGGTAASSTGAAAPTSQPAANPQPPVPVAYRAALLVEAPDLPDKVKTAIGSVVWRLDNVPQGPGQPVGTAVRADVDIPEAKVRMSLDIQKNQDATLPASHTIEVRFTLLPGNELGGVKQISTVQMRREETPNGDPLAGLPVQITDNYFLIGLARGDLEQRNMDLLKNRGWVDLPLALTNGRIAKFSLEKGAAGERVIADAITAWSQQK